MKSNRHQVSFLYSLFAFIVAWAAAVYAIRELADTSKMTPGHLTDFPAQITGAEVIKNEGVRKLYDPNIQLKYQQKIVGTELVPGPSFLAFRTPPTTAYLYSLLPTHNTRVSFWIIALTNFFCIMVAIWFLTEKNLTKTFVLGTVSVFSAPVLLTIIGGQPNGFVLLLLTVAFLNIRKERYFLAGVATALLFIKPNMLMAAPFLILLIRNKKQTAYYLAGLFIALISLILINSIWYGADFLNDYLSFLFNSENTSLGTSVENNINISNLTFTLSNFLGYRYDNRVSTIATLSLNVLTLALLWKARKKLKHEHLAATMFLVLPILNLHTNYPDLITQIITLTILAPYFYEKRKWVVLVLLLLVIVELPYYSAANLEWFVVLSTLVFTMFLLSYLKNGKEGNQISETPDK